MPSPSSFLIAPVLSLAGPDGAPATTVAQSQALSGVFQRVDRFRIEVRDGDGSLVLDTLIQVRPGQPEYDFRLGVEATPGEVLSVVLTAFEGETELFRSEPVSVEATAPAAGGGSAATPADVTLSYSGPGATATAVTPAPASVVLGPNGSAELVAEVLDGGGNALSGVPLQWTSTAEGVAGVSGAGIVSAGSEGPARVTVTTPTGLSASTWVYVIHGTLAFVEDGVLKSRPASGGTPSTLGGRTASGPAWSPDGGFVVYSDAGTVRRLLPSGRVGEGSWPTVSPDGRKVAFERDGRMAWVAGGELRVDGREAPLASGVGGRPSWSAGGAWLAVVADGGVAVVPADGSGPALPPPGLTSASHPAFRPQGALTAPPAVQVSGPDPEAPVPGGPVRIVGSGFDDIIPDNNSVLWPTRRGPTPAEIVEVGPDGLHVVVPTSPAGGILRVGNGVETASLELEPTFGAIRVEARTPWGGPVPGTGVTVRHGDGAVVSQGETDGEGTFVSTPLIPGPHSITADPPDGFTLEGPATRTVEVTTELTALELTLVPVPVRVEVSPSEPRLALGQGVAVTLRAFDANGVPIESFRSAPGRRGRTAAWASRDREPRGRSGARSRAPHRETPASSSS